jgi:hypothetical protein
MLQGGEQVTHPARHGEKVEPPTLPRESRQGGEVLNECMQEHGPKCEPVAKGGSPPSPSQ